MKVVPVPNSLRRGEDVQTSWLKGMDGVVLGTNINSSQSRFGSSPTRVTHLLSPFVPFCSRMNVVPVARRGNMQGTDGAFVVSYPYQ